MLLSKKYFPVFLLLVLLFFSCKKEYTVQQQSTNPFSATEGLNIKASIENLDSLISVGDTIEISMELPSTISTNTYGVLTIDELLTGSRFIMNSNVLDTLIKYESPIDSLTLENVVSGNTNAPGYSWDFDTRKFKILLIPNSAGRYYFDMGAKSLRFKDENGRVWETASVYIRWDENTLMNSGLRATNFLFFPTNTFPNVPNPNNISWNAASYWFVAQ